MHSRKIFRLLSIVILSFIVSFTSYAETCSQKSTDKSCSFCGKLKNEEQARREYLLKVNFKRLQSNHRMYPLPPHENKTKKINKTRKKNIKRHKHKKYTNRRKKYKANSVTNVVSIPAEIYPEKTVWLKLSNRDLNRIVCTRGPITYLLTSSEKGVETTIKNDEAYIKFKAIITNNGKIKYMNKPTEFFIRCGGDTYSFIAYPKKISAKTIYLASLTNKIKPDETLLKKNRVDEAITDIIKTVFLDRIPPSWEKPNKFRKFRIQKNINDTKIKILEQSRYRIPGIPILVRVFILNSNKRIQINEKFLLDPSIVKNPIAISLLDHILNPGLNTRAVILEKLYE